jgi:hypothetical protein
MTALSHPSSTPKLLTILKMGNFKITIFKEIFFSLQLMGLLERHGVIVHREALQGVDWKQADTADWSKPHRPIFHLWQ